MRSLTAPLSLISEALSSSLRVTYASALRRITLQRVLGSKIAFFPESVTYEEVLVFYDNLVWCLDKSVKDPDFRHKFGNSLEEISHSVKNLRFNDRDIPGSITKLSKILRPIDSFILPKRNFSGTWVHFKGKFHVVPTRSLGIPKEQIPPKPYIGVGYKDKGTRRDPSWDGSPSWQEVAMANTEKLK